jgi:dTDP-4-dehydrorhamnose reductase
MKVLITGGGGQLGLALQSALQRRSVRALTHTDLDVTDANAVHREIAAWRPGVVVHAAAWTDTAACERDPERALLVNGDGAANVAAACAETGTAMAYVSSNEVFDGTAREPYPEDAQENPVNEYGRSKLAGEHAVAARLAEHYIVRTSWLYGPGRVSFPEKILSAAREQGSLRLVTDEIASPTWTVDLAAAIAAVIERRAYGVYHLTNAGACSRKEWAEEVLRLNGVHVPVEPATQAEFGLPFRKPVMTALANNRAAELGITLRPWGEALADHLTLDAPRSPARSGAQA